MTEREPYSPGPAVGVEVQKRDGDSWTLVLVRTLRQPPEKVWKALTDPAELSQWAPFDATGNLGVAGSRVKLTTVGAPAEHVVETVVKRADAPKALEYQWGGGDMRWELEAVGGGTRLTLWSNIDRRYIAMGAAGWHICLDVLSALVNDEPIGRMVGPPLMHDPRWQRLFAEYSKQFGVEPPSWSPNEAK